MKKIIICLPLFFMLTGCPGENVGLGSWRSVMINGEHFCFSVDKHDVLNGYIISSTQQGEYKRFAVARSRRLSYPDSCLNIALPSGYSYGVLYTMNNQHYRYTFFKDNDGNIINWYQE